jgi:predicted membrane protein (TIGR00267 family)
MVTRTIVASSIALGISTGVSVYESEMLERERRIAELEKALFRKLDDTKITENYRTYAIILSFVNFCTPLICCVIVIIPLIFAQLQLLEIVMGPWISIILALAILFVTGTYLGRIGKQNPLLKGVRMVIFGIAAFALGYIIQFVI